MTSRYWSRGELQVQLGNCTYSSPCGFTAKTQSAKAGGFDSQVREDSRVGVHIYIKRENGKDLLYARPVGAGSGKKEEFSLGIEVERAAPEEAAIVEDAPAAKGD